MTATIWKHVGVVVLLATVAASGCTSAIDDSERFSVEDNALGVVAIAIDRTADSNGHSFHLRGLNASEDEVASVRLTTGRIADLTRYLPGTHSDGSEIVLAYGGARTRIYTRERVHFQLDRASNPSMQAFLELETVASVLAREARILIDRPRAGVVLETAFSTQSCPREFMMTSPTAGQCCYQSDHSNPHTRHFNIGGANDGAHGYRLRSPYGPCKAQNGGSCSGDACYWGPNGFARPQISTCDDPSYCGAPRISTWTDPGGSGTYCEGGWYSHPPPLEFGDVTGTFATGQGCPGGGGTGAGEWDY